LSLLLDALKRAESQKKRAGDSNYGASRTVPDVDLSAIDPVSVQRQGAANLFNAKRPGYNNYAKAKLLAIAGSLALLLGAAGFYAWYWYNTSFPSASQISLSNNTLPAPGAARPATPAPTQPVAPAASSVASTPVATSGADNTPAPAAPPKTNIAPALKPAAKRVAKPPKVTPMPLPARSAISALPPNSAVVTPRTATAAISTDPENSIRLRRSTEEIYAINPDIAAAYQALVAGRLAEAKQLYENVLQKDPANVDAELGLATIAAKNHDAAEAARRYRRVLELDRKNPVAQAGSAGLVNDLPQTENQLRAQAAQQPQSAPLAAALGNIYATQGRWNEAQQAYFDALRFDANNPDYTFNLAVSLDQLNQPKLALEHYQRALTLANVRASQFSKDAATARIAELMRQN
jgi:Tfp pilus assembly protein PilF